LVGLDRHWLRSTGFTLLLVGLVAAAIGADWTATLSSLVTCAVGFGFFYLLFPGGAHFGMTVANFLAIYACMFEFFRDANFPAAPRNFALGAVAMPVLAFLAGCVMRRRQVYSIIHARRIRELDHMPHISGWLLGALAVGVASFAMPRLQFDAFQQGVALLAARPQLGDQQPALGDGPVSGRLRADQPQQVSALRSVSGGGGREVQQTAL